MDIDNKIKKIEKEFEIMKILSAQKQAVKEFADRLKQKLYYCEIKNGKDNFVVNEMDINELLKEFMEGKND